MSFLSSLQFSQQKSEKRANQVPRSGERVLLGGRWYKQCIQCKNDKIKGEKKRES
jgi:hypothetical protein